MRRIIIWVADAFSSQVAILIALIWSLLPFVFPQYQVMILYVSAGVVQLVALPLLAWQNATQTKHHEAVRQSHDDLHKKLDALHEHLAMKGQTDE